MSKLVNDDKKWLQSDDFGGNVISELGKSKPKPSPHSYAFQSPIFQDQACYQSQAYQENARAWGLASEQVVDALCHGDERD